MKRAAAAAAWLSLIVLIAVGPFWLAESAAGREEMVRRRYETWTGVLRLWKCEGWESGSGSLTAWLNECISAFEKSHPGAYIQITDVPEETLRAFDSGGVNPPDMIVWAPGMLDAPYSLMAMEEEQPLRPALSGAGLWQGTRYAVPVALGGYALAVNTRLIPDTPADWGEVTMDGKESRTAAVLNAPADGNSLSWSAALISLFAGGVTGGAGPDVPPVGEGIDLGLTAAEAEETERPQQGKEELRPNRLPEGLAEDFRTEAGVYSQFVSGKIAAMPVTQREIRRLQLLSESGKGPDWRVECIGSAFTDQLALFSIVAWPREDAEARQSLAEAFMNLMLSQDMQRKLTMARAFSVIGTADLYPGSREFGPLEDTLNGPELTLPPAFGQTWRAYAQNLADGLQTGGQTLEAWRLLREMMTGKEQKSPA